MTLDKDGRLDTIDDLYEVWKKFAEKEDIELKENQIVNVEKILCPDYNPTERIMIEILVGKIKKEIKPPLLEKFEEEFGNEIGIWSPIKDLN